MVGGPLACLGHSLIEYVTTTATEGVGIMLLRPTKQRSAIKKKCSTHFRAFMNLLVSQTVASRSLPPLSHTKLPLSSCSLSIASNKLLKFPAPNPSKLL